MHLVIDYARQQPFARRVDHLIGLESRITRHVSLAYAANLIAFDQQGADKPTALVQDRRIFYQ